VNFIRLHVTAEGQTEERFVKDVLCPHLGLSNISADVRSVLTSKDRRAHREYRGGLKSYDKARLDIVTWLKEDQNADARFTAMFDLYALPVDFPDFAKASRTDPYKRVAQLEKAFAADIGDRRFVPYIQLHEFEALVLSEPGKLLDDYFEREAEIQRLVDLLADHHGNPELIDGGEETAPSKRILSHIPEYDKVRAGPGATGRIGVDFLRAKCRHFGEWLTKLEWLSRG
jgi:hypothetical protein